MSFKLQDTNHDQWMFKYEQYKPTEYMEHIVTYSNMIFNNFVNQTKDNKINKPSDVKLELYRWVSKLFPARIKNNIINDENYSELIDDLMLAVDEHIQKGKK